MNGQQDKPAGGRSSGEVVIELGDEGNRNIMFQPLQADFRGRYERRHLNGRIDAENYPLLEKLDVIPGAYVCLDVAGARGRVVDPLSLKKSATLAREVLEAMKQVEGSSLCPFDERVVELKQPNQLATWAHWMVELVKRGKARLVEGELPDVSKLPGRVKVDHFNSHPRAATYADQMAPAGA